MVIDSNWNEGAGTVDAKGEAHATSPCVGKGENQRCTSLESQRLDLIVREVELDDGFMFMLMR